MRGKFLQKVKKRLLISTLTMLCIMAQFGSTVALAATNKDITDLINEVGFEVSVVIEEDVVDKPVAFRSNRTSSFGSYTDNALSNSSSFKSSKTGSTSTETTNKKGTYSSDGRYYYGGYTGTKYVTTKYLSEQHPGLKKDLESKFGVDSFNLEGYGYGTSLWDVLIRKNNPINKAINSKSMRLELGTIGVENKLQKKNSYAASHLVPLFTYYGVINTEDGLLDYTHDTDNYLSREQGALMLGRFMHSEAYMMDSIDGSSKEDGAYNAYVAHYQGNMLLSSGKYGLTEKDLESSMTRLEFIYMLMKYFPEDVKEAAISKKTCAEIFNDVTKKDLVTEKWLKDNKLLGSDGYAKNSNLTAREMLKDKKVANDGIVEAAYKLGILKKDSKGKANLFKPITKSQAIRMLADMANAVAKDKSITYGN